MIEIFVRIGEDNLDAADRFTLAVEDAIEKLAANPGMGALREFYNPHLEGIRSWPIKHFQNYLVFYFPLEDGIHVLRTVHGSRNIPTILGEVD
jgi:toxin ParE1/3/4